jgi:hypothetical protein
MTAVEWLEDNFGYIQSGNMSLKFYFQQALKIEKQQIIDAYICGRFEEDKITRDDRFYARQYYKKYFKKTCTTKKEVVILHRI